MNPEVLKIMSALKAAKKPEKVQTITPQDARRAAARKLLDAFKQDNSELLLNALDEITEINSFTPEVENDDFIDNQD